MVFSSLTFIYIFLPITLLIYNFSKDIKYKNFVLLLASLFFYSWGEPRYIVLLITTSLLNFFSGKYIAKNLNSNKAKIALAITVFYDIFALVIFKYAGFLLSSTNNIFSTKLNIPDIALPIGISFYTFQILTYVIDVYRKDVGVQKSFVNFLLYVSMFPQLVAGPIVRYSDVEKQIVSRKVKSDDFVYGIRRFLLGLSKKILIANHAGSVVELFLNVSISDFTTLSLWYGVFMYTLQIYFDFSAYSDMAIGLGKMLGFTFVENFEYPYISQSVTEFWRRWHISLSTFFRDYVYIPLGGNRKRQIRNIIIVWALTGIWHGANWNFIIWGLFYGIILIIEKEFLLGFLKKIPSFFRHFYLIFIVMIGWTLFYFVDTAKLIEALKTMFTLKTTPEDDFVWQSIKNNMLFIVMAVFLSTNKLKLIAENIKLKLDKKYNSSTIFTLIHTSSNIIINFLLLFINTALLTGESYNPFLYFRF